jgi:hypothetical protein
MADKLTNEELGLIRDHVLPSFRPNPDTGNWIIVVGGVRVYPNGTDKRCWSTKGSARYALNNHLMYNGFLSDILRVHRQVAQRDANNGHIYFNLGQLGEYNAGYYESAIQVKKMVDGLIKDGFIEIIKVV